MKILLTGGAGFIGSHLCGKLLDEGYDVIVVDNFDDFYDPKEKRKNISNFHKKKNFKLVKGDIRNNFLLDKIFRNKIDKVVHLAAKAGVRYSIKYPQEYMEVNVLGTLNLLELTKKYSVSDFVFASSSSVYGERSKVPFKETDRVDRPISPYAASKVSAEQVCYTYHHLYDIPIKCLRLFTVYGPRQRPDLAIRKFIKAIEGGNKIDVYGDGSSERDYTYIDDIVEGILRAIKTKMSFEIINLGNSQPIKLKNLIALIEKLLGKKAKINRLPPQPGDVSRTYADIAKADKLLGWRPKVKIEDGLAMMIEWYVSDAKKA